MNVCIQYMYINFTLQFLHIHRNATTHTPIIHTYHTYHMHAHATYTYTPHIHTYILTNIPIHNPYLCTHT
ncbi:hypothetical protein EON63_14460 [archaeon]|nr:MAG: hypothetical protein EON63_14460 [archaeon]